MDKERALGAVARGRWGEAQALRWYQRNGYRLLARNWRGSAGELDLVVGRAGLVVVCEVKARSDERFGPAAAAVGPTKQRRLRRLAAEWLAVTATHGVAVRFDVVTVTGVRVEVIEAAF